MIALLTVANTLDALTLAGMLALGLPEGNPLVAQLLAHGGLAPVLALKAAAIVLVLTTIRICRGRRRTVRAVGLVAVVAGLVGTASNVVSIAVWP
jgi:hypothetical protein